jgi:hypothetical protein
MNKQNLFLFVGGVALGAVAFYSFKKTTSNFVGGSQFFKAEKSAPYTI